ncbi:MAG: hypothetical protein K2L01_07345 [Rikenellaceae bacterium]|nr:hypothetical protein [Rikenellaceae bacterium]
MFALQEVIIESHDDLDIWSAVTVGFDDEKNLVVLLEYIDYDDRHNDNHNTSAIIDKEEAVVLSRRLGVSVTALPKIIFDRYGDTTDLSGPSYVEEVFKEILDLLNDNLVRYRIKRD